MVAKVDKDDVVAKLATPEPRQEQASTFGPGRFDVVLEEVDHQLEEEKYCVITFDLGVHRGRPGNLRNAIC